MLAIALFSWWYTTAWKDLGRRIERRIQRALDFFSVGLLLRTLFDPFRQIAAGSAHGSMDAQMKAWADRTFSRVVGGALRGIFVVIGTFAVLLLMIIGFIQMILWPCIPLIPLVAILGLALGWTA